MTELTRMTGLMAALLAAMAGGGLGGLVAAPPHARLAALPVSRGARGPGRIDRGARDCGRRWLLAAAALWTLATMTAAALGRRWRLAALGAGGELREFEQARVALWRALARARPRARRSRARGEDVHRQPGRADPRARLASGRAVRADDRRRRRAAAASRGPARADRRRDRLGQDGQRAPLAARADPRRRRRRAGHRPEGRPGPGVRSARGRAPGAAPVRAVRSARPAIPIAGTRCGARTPARS